MASVGGFPSYGTGRVRYRLDDGIEIADRLISFWIYIDYTPPAEGSYFRVNLFIQDYREPSYMNYEASPWMDVPPKTWVEYEHHFPLDFEHPNIQRIGIQVRCPSDWLDPTEEVPVYIDSFSIEVPTVATPTPTPTPIPAGLEGYIPIVAIVVLVIIVILIWVVMRRKPKNQT
ncbi:MAG: hypothetical protein ACUVQ0_01755 [Thermoproteota archaeon]